MENKSPFSVTTWLIIVIASIGFLFDTYELLMTPLAAPPAIAELLDVPPSHPSVTLWTGRLLWITALCGGVFGLIGGALTDALVHFLSEHDLYRCLRRVCCRHHLAC
jgi:hypothetical protein